MNVAELKELLNEYPDTARVVVDGYEGGVNDITGAELIKIKLNANTEWYYGKHERVEEQLYPYDSEYDEFAVHIEFTRPIQ